MKVPHRINFELFDDNLKTLINATAKIFPMSYADVLANLNPNAFEYARVLDVGVHKNEIYYWNVSAFELIGADDLNIVWDEVKNKPVSFIPSAHLHVKTDVTDFSHYHTRVDITDFTHTHIKTDIADFAHAHVKLDITDFPILSTVASSGNYTDLIGKPTIPTDTNQLAKTDVYTKTQVDTSLGLKSDTAHDHDGRYFTQSQVTSSLTGKSDTTHNHDVTYAVKATEGTVTNQGTLITGLRTDTDANTNDIAAIEISMANGDMHSNISILNQLTQILLDSWNSAVTHISDAVKHITGAERTAWNAKSNFSGVYTDLTSKPSIPTTTSELTNDLTFQTSAQVATSISGKADKAYVDTGLAGKADSTTLSGHTGNSTVHVLQTDKDTWNAKQTALSGDVVGHYHTTDRYTHPTTHPPSIIEQDASNRFVTDAEKTTWNTPGTEITLGTVQPSTGWWFKQV